MPLAVVVARAARDERLRITGARTHEAVGDEADSPKLASLFVEGNAPSLPLCTTGVWKRQSVVFLWSCRLRLGTLQEYVSGLVSRGIAGCVVWLTLCLACLPSSMLRAEAQVQAFPDLDLPTLGQRAQAALKAHPDQAIPYMIEIRGRLSSAASAAASSACGARRVGWAHPIRWLPHSRHRSPKASHGGCAAPFRWAAGKR